jgi:NAD(P)-dependent dehydrogenase (short-subunit alcohol dehydrogenase family)
VTDTSETSIAATAGASRPLADRIALVTGASRGIGYATALALARAGAHVVAVARTVGGLEELDDAVRAAGSSATLTPLDVRDYSGLYRLAAALNERYGRLDVLVGNAAVAGVPSPLDHIEPKAWDEMMAVNVTANWHLIRAMDPLLKRSDAGRAVFVTSGAATLSLAYWAPYSVTKAALDMLVRTYAEETSNTKVRVNLFNPGPTRTRMRALAMPGEDPMTLPTPQDVAEKIVPLCLPAFSQTGKVYDFGAGKLLEFMRPS